MEPPVNGGLPRSQQSSEATGIQAGGDVTLVARGGDAVGRDKLTIHQATFIVDDQERTVPFLVPPRPQHTLVGREDLLNGIREQLIGGRSVATWGLPGAGKTALAIALGYDANIIRSFRDGILWASLGRDVDASSRLAEWAVALNIPPDQRSNLTNLRDLAGAIQRVIGLRRMLMVVDDAWSLEAASAFLLGGPNCAQLVTTRHRDIAANVLEGWPIRVPELDEQGALELLHRFAPLVVEHQPAESQTLIRAVGGLPLGLTLMGNYLKKEEHSGQPRRLATALERLQTVRERLELSERRNPLQGQPSLPSDAPLSLTVAIGLSDEALDEDGRQALRALSVLPPKPSSFSEEGALAVGACSANTLDLLVDQGMLEVGDLEDSPADANRQARYAMHQTISDYARYRLTDKRAFVRFANFYLEFVEANASNYSALAAEFPNIVAALEAAYDSDLHLKFAGGVRALAGFLEDRGEFSLSERNLRRGLETVKSSPMIEEQARQVEIAATSAKLYKLAAQRLNINDATMFVSESFTAATKIGEFELVYTLLIGLGQLAFLLGRSEDGEQFYRKAIDIGLARENPDWATESFVELTKALATVKSDRTRETLDQALLLAERATASVRQAAYKTLASVARKIGNAGQAKQLLEKALDLSEPTADVGSVDEVLFALADLSNAEGDRSAADRYYSMSESLHREQLEGAEAKDESLRAAQALLRWTLLELERGDLRRAEQLTGQAIAIVRDVGAKDPRAANRAVRIDLLRATISMLMGISSIAMHRSEYELAERFLREAADVVQEADSPEQLLQILMSFGDLAVNRNQYDDAKQFFNTALAVAQDAGFDKYEIDAWLRLGDVSLLERKFEDSDLLYERAASKAGEAANLRYGAKALFGLARVAAEKGDLSEARRQGQEGADVLDLIGDAGANEIREWLDQLETHPV